MSRYRGTFEHVFESNTAGVTIQSPQLGINTVAAGSGSILFWRNGLFIVGGPLTVTDANLFLGRLIPELIPKIFGEAEDQPLDVDIRYWQDSDARRGCFVVFLDVANEAMCRPIRALTEGKGYDIASHNLAVFGGAGGQHACDIARTLKISTVVIHRFSSILSAYGMVLADVVDEAQEPVNEIYSVSSRQHLERRLSKLRSRVEKQLLDQGNRDLDHGAAAGYGDFAAEFRRTHLREFWFCFPDEKPIYVDDVRVRGIGASERKDWEVEQLGQQLRDSTFKPAKVDLAMGMTGRVYFPKVGYPVAPVYLVQSLPAGVSADGPAIIVDQTQTLVVAPDTVAKPMMVDHIQLSVFGHRFMSIAEQMGRALQQTAVSLNIKERLHFSCALFGAEGDLVANAPHVPVHLRSMSYAVKHQHELHKGKLIAGDVLVANTPRRRYAPPRHHCHYARVREDWINGGTSMPPNSTELWQEGASIRSFKLIHGGEFDEKGITVILLRPGRYPGCTGSRHIQDNLSDLKAQALIEEYTLPTVQLYSGAIQSNAELAVRSYLTTVRERLGPHLRATDQMDNGTLIKLSVSISPDGSATFDFTGTGVEMLSDINAPPAITHSAIIDTLRLLIGTDIPLNQGCLAPITTIIPKGSFLNPSSGPAVCAGNTQTSQRVVDVILRAFRAAAASNGCMNCLGFFGGDTNSNSDSTVPGSAQKGVSYAFGETICGDPESLEKRYPVLLREFAIRRGTGGKGIHNGGDRVVRDIECRAPLSFSVITERRSVPPYGMEGGGEGERGATYWVRKLKEEDGNGDEWRWVNMGVKNMVRMQAGHWCVIHTPGGGGWGVPGLAKGNVNGDIPRVQEQYPRASGSVSAYAAAQGELN
ncbi:Hydantoinase B/oxoprolinase-domain-containing protein [Aspergillus desertorum]